MLAVEVLFTTLCRYMETNQLQNLVEDQEILAGFPNAVWWRGWGRTLTLGQHWLVCELSVVLHARHAESMKARKVKVLVLNNAFRLKEKPQFSRHSQRVRFLDTNSPRFYGSHASLCTCCPVKPPMTTLGIIGQLWITQWTYWHKWSQHLKRIETSKRN